MMAFKKYINDLSGILVLVLLYLPAISANIDCNGKPFHCVNTTHFMICVDLGSGVSSTIDDFIIPCPPTTVCLGTNRFECEFPAVTTTTTVAAPAAFVTETVYGETAWTETTSDVNDVTTSIPFEEYFNTISSTTLSDVIVTTEKAATEPAGVVSDFTENVNVISNNVIPSETVNDVQNDAKIFDNPKNTVQPTNIVSESVMNLTGSLSVAFPDLEFDSTFNQTKSDVVQNTIINNTQSNMSEHIAPNATQSDFNSTSSKAITSDPTDAVKYEITTLVVPSITEYLVTTESALSTQSNQVFDYNSTSNQTTQFISSTDGPYKALEYQQNSTVLSNIDYDAVINFTETSRFELNPVLNEATSSVLVADIQYEPTTLVIPSSTDLTIDQGTDSIIMDVIGNLSGIKHDSNSSKNIPITSYEEQNETIVYTHNVTNSILTDNIGNLSDIKHTLENKQNSNPPNKINNSTVSNSTETNVTQFHPNTNDAFPYELAKLITPSSIDLLNNIRVDSISTNAIGNLINYTQDSENKPSSSQTISSVPHDVHNATNGYQQNSNLLNNINNNTVSNSTKTNMNQSDINYISIEAISSDPVEAIPYESSIVVTPSSLDLQTKIETEPILPDAIENISDIKKDFDNQSSLSQTTSSVPYNVYNATNEYDQNSNLPNNINNNTDSNSTDVNISQSDKVNPISIEAIPSDSVDAIPYESSAVVTLRTLGFHTNIETDSILVDVIGKISNIKQDSENKSYSSQIIAPAPYYVDNATNGYERNSNLLDKISNVSNNSTETNFNQSDIYPVSNEAISIAPVEAVLNEPTMIVIPNSTDSPNNVGSESIITGNLNEVKNPFENSSFLNGTNLYKGNSSMVNNNTVVKNSIEIHMNNFDVNSDMSETISSMSVDAVQYESTTLMTPSAIDFSNNILTLLNNATGNIDVIERVVPQLNTTLTNGFVADDSAPIKEVTHNAPFLQNKQDIPLNLVNKSTSGKTSLIVTRELEYYSNLNKNIPTNGVRNDTKVKSERGFASDKKIAEKPIQTNVTESEFVTISSEVIQNVNFNNIQNEETVLTTPNSKDLPIKVDVTSHSVSIDVPKNNLGELPKLNSNSTFLEFMSKISYDEQNNTIIYTDSSMALPTTAEDITIESVTDLFVDSVVIEQTTPDTRHSTVFPYTVGEEIVTVTINTGKQNIMSTIETENTTKRVVNKTITSESGDITLKSSTTLQVKKRPDAYFYQGTTPSTAVKENQPLVVIHEPFINNLLFNSTADINNTLTTTATAEIGYSILSTIKEDDTENIEIVQNIITEKTESTSESLSFVYEDNTYFHGETENISNVKEILTSDGKPVVSENVLLTGSTDKINSNYTPVKKNKLLESSIPASDTSTDVSFPIPLIHLTPNSSAVTNSRAINTTSYESEKLSLVFNMENPKVLPFSDSHDQSPSTIIKQTDKVNIVNNDNNNDFILANDSNSSAKLSFDDLINTANYLKEGLKNGIIMSERSTATFLQITETSTESTKSTITSDVTITEPTTVSSTESPKSTITLDDTTTKLQNQTSILTDLQGDVNEATTTKETVVTELLSDKNDTIQDSFPNINFDTFQTLGVIDGNVIDDVKLIKPSKEELSTEKVSETITLLRANLDEVSVKNNPNISSNTSSGSDKPSSVEATSMKSDAYTPTTTRYLSSAEHQPYTLIVYAISDLTTRPAITGNTNSVTNENKKFSNSVDEVNGEVSINSQTSNIEPLYQPLPSTSKILNAGDVINTNIPTLSPENQDINMLSNTVTIRTKDSLLQINNVDSSVATTVSENIDIPSTEPNNPLRNLLLNSLPIQTHRTSTSRPMVSKNIESNANEDAVPNLTNSIQQTITAQTVLNNQDVTSYTNQINESEFSDIYNKTETSRKETEKSPSVIITSPSVYLSEMITTNQTSQPTTAKIKPEITELIKETSKSHQGVDTTTYTNSPSVSPIITLDFDKPKSSSQAIHSKHNTSPPKKIEKKVDYVTAKYDDNKTNKQPNENQIEAPSNSKKIPVTIENHFVTDANKNLTLAYDNHEEITEINQETNLTQNVLDQPLNLAHLFPTTIVPTITENGNKSWNPAENANPSIQRANPVIKANTLEQVFTGSQVTEININLTTAYSSESNHATLKHEIANANTQPNNVNVPGTQHSMKTYTPDADFIIIDTTRKTIHTTEEEQNSSKTHSAISANQKLLKKLNETSEAENKLVLDKNLETPDLRKLTNYTDSKTKDIVNEKFGHEPNESFDREGILDRAAFRMTFNKDISTLDSKIVKSSAQQKDAFNNNFLSNIKSSVYSTIENATRNTTLVKPQSSSISPNKSILISSTETNVKSKHIIMKSNTTSRTTRYTPPAKSTFKNTHTIRSLATPNDVQASNFDCKHRGRYSDEKDCQKFYICIGKPEPIHGKCPNKTVFSEIRKQCTKNLSHCYRNNQFQCVSEGRFFDLLKDNIYYVCVKNNLGTFIRFKLQCQSGYNLNKTSVRCVLNIESSIIFSNINRSNKSVQSVSMVTNQKIVESTEKSSASDNSKNKSDQSLSSAKVEDVITSKPFECKKEGKFADAINCRRYYICTKISKSRYRIKRKKCDSDETFHKDKKKCVDADSYECS